MRRIIGAFLISLAAAALTVYGSWTVDTSFDRMNSQLKAALFCSQQGEYEKADDIYRQLYEEWDSRERLLGLFMKLDVLSEISGMIRETAGYNDPDHQAELKSETARTLDRIRTAKVLFFSVC